MKFFSRHYGELDGPIRSKKPYAILTQDNWDDFGYKTSFKVVLVLEDRDVSLGSVKIAKQNQGPGFTRLRTSFTKVPKTYFSLGQDTDYYEQLLLLGRTIYDGFLRGLGDVVYDQVKRAEFEDEEAFRVSLVRFSGASRSLEEATSYFDRSRAAAPSANRGFRLLFKTRFGSSSKAFVANFDFLRKRAIPYRMNALIGYNGTGKTRLLSNLAKVSSGYGFDSVVEQLNSEAAAGRFVGRTPPVKRVLVVSYSAFDSFEIPGKTEAEREELRESGEIFGYAYCGLRIIDTEADENGPSDADVGIQHYRLKTSREIEADFVAAFRRIRRLNREDEFRHILLPLLEESSFQAVGLSDIFTDARTLDRISLFRSLSTGHKIVLKIISEITSLVDGKSPSLILIDEPESHLHPPLLAALLRSIRAILDRLNSYCIIATHSPVVLQEIPARSVRVLRRMGSTNTLSVPDIETFGENIGVITQQVFNLDDGSTDWHRTLDEISETMNLGEIERLFGRPLGFSARSYILVSQDRDEEF